MNKIKKHHKIHNSWYLLYFVIELDRSCTANNDIIFVQVYYCIDTHRIKKILPLAVINHKVVLVYIASPLENR